ncbi:hypothetical protein GCM10025875_29530 [Litorihabitans aurantiacus]|uniref:Uncharacterized protein n=1 Tax=Litorihabitans aurantiacus TaxID=1930061 RepID=A0AA37XH44_9MICO|nr:hypothetical protein GCM10025875_29530 [Litorihabitans aurantiacus]
MFMGLPDPITAGDDVDITLTLADGSDLEFVAVAKDYEGANESYERDGGTDHGDMGDSDTGHGETAHGDHEGTDH